MTNKKLGVRPMSYILQKGDSAEFVEGAVIEEVLACIYVNGQELAKFMCTPHRLDELALGFLRSEGIIQRLDDIEVLTTSASHCVDIWLKDTGFSLPTRPIITSGCGGGVTFDDLSQRHTPLNTNTTIKPEQIFSLMKKLHEAAELYQEARGVHTSALSDGGRLMLVAQDVGRHNTIDRLWGQALKQGLRTDSRILLASGRISSEMLTKTAKMGVPIVISRTSPTSLSVDLGQAWNITIIGYARGNSYRVYTAPERVMSSQALPVAVSGQAR